jgi:general secretion pathway protein K
MAISSQAIGAATVRTCEGKQFSRKGARSQRKPCLCSWRVFAPLRLCETLVLFFSRHLRERFPGGDEKSCGREEVSRKGAKLAKKKVAKKNLFVFWTGFAPLRENRFSSRRGSALLMVLWISAALAAVAFSLATTVRGETDRTSTGIDGIRGYYLAAGAVDRAAVEVLWSALYPGDSAKIKKGSAWVDYTFPTGVAHVELIPEASKLDVNSVAPDRLMRLLMAIGVEPGRAMEITSGIVARRGGGGANVSSSPSLTPSPTTGPSFPGVAASFQELEELLSVRGITPEIFYGTYVPAQSANGSGEPRLIRRSGLVECLSVFGSSGLVDANTADPAVLAAVGIPPDGIQFVVQGRRDSAFTPERLAQLTPMLGPGGGMLRLGGNSILTVRATARVRLPNGQLSDMRRTVGAVVKYMPPKYDSPIHILRWYDTTWGTTQSTTWSN